MKVRCITNQVKHLTKGNIYDVVSEDISIYYVVNDEGAYLSYLKTRFEVVVLTEEEQLKIAKEEVKRLEKLIEDKKPKVGDRYKITSGYSKDGELLLCKIKGRYALVITKHRNEREVGRLWIDKLSDTPQEAFKLYGFNNLERLI